MMVVTRPSSSTGIVPHMGAWLSDLLRSGPRPVDRALGAAATLGLSMIILRLVGQAVQARKQGQHQGDSKTSKIRLLQNILQYLLSSGRDSDKPESSRLAVHRGSCHCRAVHFELLAPQTLVANEGPVGKIRYPHVRAAASRLRFSKGTDRLQMYYVSVAETVDENCGDSTASSRLAAHTFCSQCGVHILYAPSAESDELEVNVDLLKRKSRKNMKLTHEEDHLATGTSVEEQWTMEDNENVRNASFWGSVDEGSLFAKYDDGAISLMDKSAAASPGTPSTVTTTGTDTYVTRSRSFHSEQESAASEDTEDVLQLKVAQPLSTALPTMLESPTSTSSATPMMRDQLKYYMSKHLPSSRASTMGADRCQQAAVPSSLAEEEKRDDVPRGQE